MPAVTDCENNTLQVGDQVATTIQMPVGKVKITEIRPILERGPRNGGIHVEATMVIAWDLPPGHTAVPCFLLFNGHKEAEKIPTPDTIHLA